MRTKLIAALLAQGLSGAAAADGFLRADGQQIVDGSGAPVILRGMGLGGWMLQEGYMLKLGEFGQQHVIRRKIEDLIGPERTGEFYRAWRANHLREEDIKALAGWGYNSVRLPMHYNLYTLPVAQEPVAGENTWLDTGFELTDQLLAWCKKYHLYLILDLHAAPGGQGNDLAISDRDPNKPSLWDSAANRAKTVALWRKLAARYKNEPNIAAYDLINEPNWGFSASGDAHGCGEQANWPLRQLYLDITAAIRAEDQRHMLVIEGNCWGNNYASVLPPWDANMALSFHKYWNNNDRASIADKLALRERYDVPLWLGESGENSNAWFADAIELVEGQGIGWAFWPLKKIGFNNPLEITPNPGYRKLLAYWKDGGPKPSPEEAYAALMQLAREDIRFANNRQHIDVVDAMLRQPHSDSTRPFRTHKVGAAGAIISAADYDLGRPGRAYADTDLANYHVSTGGPRTPWNRGRIYRNDGVDLAATDDGNIVVTDMAAGEWLQYTLQVVRTGRYRITALLDNADADTALSVSAGDSATELHAAQLANRNDIAPARTQPSATIELQKGTQKIRIKVESGAPALRQLRIEPL
ncbi:cellulase family glycosylhydrolase [Microbulbifer sp. SAOS-129_SWC]|uniref:cellulase family glycosylhydrolase n=1 Tax=Microbulbifer sp. SAOS-129_SWC TaxID=3145235 RepID=UPI0032163F97